MFGDYVKEKRQELGMSLREFCKKINEDSSNWSKIERNILLPPKDLNRLKIIAKVLNLNSLQEQQYLEDIANVSSGVIPQYIMSNVNIINNLPAFLRTIDNVRPSQEEFKILINKLKEI